MAGVWDATPELDGVGCSLAAGVCVTGNGEATSVVEGVGTDSTLELGRGDGGRAALALGGTIGDSTEGEEVDGVGLTAVEVTDGVLLSKAIGFCEDDGDIAGDEGDGRVVGANVGMTTREGLGLGIVRPVLLGTADGDGLGASKEEEGDGAGCPLAVGIREAGTSEATVVVEGAGSALGLGGVARIALALGETVGDRSEGTVPDGVVLGAIADLDGLLLSEGFGVCEDDGGTVADEGEGSVVRMRRGEGLGLELVGPITLGAADGDEA
jgi:hypothetical protein